MKKIDYALAGLIGFFAGIFAIPVIYNIYNPLSGILRHGHNPFVLLALPWVVAIAALIGIFIAGFLGKKFPFFIQFAKFAVVGVLNTAIDFGTLNLMSIITGVTSGIVVGGVNVPGVSLALMNAYFWNKYWVFSHRDNGKNVLQDFPKFLLVSGIGVIVNSGIVIFATSYPLLAVNPKTWLNLAKASATVFSLVWNFLGYKFIVFRSSQSEETPQREPIAPL